MVFQMYILEGECLGVFTLNSFSFDLCAMARQQISGLRYIELLRG